MTETLSKTFLNQKPRNILLHIHSNGHVIYYAHTVNTVFSYDYSGLYMRISKLELYIDILEVLAKRRALKLTHIMYKANVNCKILKEHLDFLIKQGLIEKHVVGNDKVIYANTAQGTEILKFFRELEKMLPIMAQASTNEIKTLPTEMQEILVDDLATAFQNRMKVVKQAVVNEASSNLNYYVELGVTIPQ